MFRFHKVLNIEHVTDFTRLSYYFSNAGKELYLVGGCVRDMLLGKEPKDYDLCTNATPEEVIEILSGIGVNDEMHRKAKEAGMICLAPNPKLYSIIGTGLKHGTVTVHDTESDQFYEITTYRIDGKYSDGRHPDEVIFTPNLEEDLKRRDFTINSFAYDLNTDEVVMLDESFLYDLELGVIRCVGDPNKRFEEDALRMLRAFRFAAQLGFTIERDTYEAIKTNNFRLEAISKERIRDELTKIVMSDNPQLLELFVVAGLETYALNGITPLGDILNCPHDNPWHYTDVFHHTMDVIKKCPKDFNTRWAALFHDLGKPSTKALKEGTADHYNFHGHPEVSARIAMQIMETLKFSNEAKENIERFVRLHDYPLSETSNKKFKQKIVEIGEDKFSNFLKLRQADAESHALKMSTKYAIDAVSKCKERFRDYLMHKPPVTLKDLALNGNDMIQIGFEGRDIGNVLRRLLDYVLENPEKNNKLDLLDYVQKMLEEFDI